VGVRFHDLRHEAISRFFEKGLTHPEVAAVSGHRTVSQLFRYAHSDLQRLRDKLAS
jgi:integrase